MLKGRCVIDRFRRDTAAACGELRAQIRDAAENTRENELSLQIQGRRAASAARSGECDAELKKRAQLLKARIEGQLAIDSAAVSEIEKEVASAGVEHLQQREAVESGLAWVKGDCEKEIDEIRAAAERQAEKCRRAHAFAVNQLTQQIQEAESQRRDLQERQERERAELCQRQRADLELKAEDNARSNAAYFADTELKKSELGEKIAHLSRQAVDAEIRCLVPEQRDKERRAIDGVIGRIRIADKRTETEFENIFRVIREAPNKVPEPEAKMPETPAPTPRSSARSYRSARSSHNSTPRALRRDASLLVPSMKIKERKKASLVTPVFY
jgi:hypothetical protein